MEKILEKLNQIDTNMKTMESNLRTEMKTVEERQMQRYGAMEERQTYMIEVFAKFHQNQGEMMGKIDSIEGAIAYLRHMVSIHDERLFKLENNNLNLVW